MMAISENTKDLLIIEDDPGLQKQLKWCLSGYNVFIAHDRESAIEILNLKRPSVVTLDLGLPPDPTNATEGLATLEQILIASPKTKVIVVTGNEERENALKAVALGAYDYYQKPIEPEILSLIVDRAYQLNDLEQENTRLANRNYEGGLLKGFIASSPQISKICKTIEKIAPTNVTTLLLGESGTGKELLARAIHNLSSRRENSFIAINCAAIPENLLESELFGYEKGAFTGAHKRTLGKFEYASEGTLFLDEIGDLSQTLQAKLLRFLQERVIERVGGREEIPVDVRIICATHQDLDEQMKSGQFREDLFYRISEISIKIPPLRERIGDTILLAKHFMNQSKTERDKEYRFTKSAIFAIENYGWPGNVRELENRVKRATIMAENNLVDEADLELSDEDGYDDLESLNLRIVRESAEKEVILKALSRASGKVTRTAELLGVSRPTLYDLLAKHDLKDK
jgi:two-component system, NtrC family, response regulator